MQASDWISLAAFITSLAAIGLGEWRERRKEGLSQLAEEEAHIGKLLLQLLGARDVIVMRCEEKAKSGESWNPQCELAVKFSIEKVLCVCEIEHLLPVLRSAETEGIRTHLQTFLKDSTKEEFSGPWILLCLFLMEQHFRIAAKLPSPRYNFHKQHD